MEFQVTKKIRFGLCFSMPIVVFMNNFLLSDRWFCHGGLDYVAELNTFSAKSATEVWKRPSCVQLEIVVNIFLQFDCTEVTQHVAYYYCVLLSHNKLQLSDFQLLLLYTAVPNKQPAAHKKQLGNKYCLRLIMSHI